jgi:hypothetical protein
MVARVEQIRIWLRELTSHGAAANARRELERRAAEETMLAILEVRVVPVSAPEPAAA